MEIRIGFLLILSIAGSFLDPLDSLMDGEEEPKKVSYHESRIFQDAHPLLVDLQKFTI